MQVHEYGDTLVVWHLITKHNQLSGKTSLYGSTGCNWKGSFTGEEVRHDPDQLATLFCFRKFSLVLLITLPPTELCFSTLDEVGNHLYVADRSICDQDQDVVKRLHQIIKQCGYHFVIRSTQELQTKHNFCSSIDLILVTNASTSVRSD